MNRRILAEFKRRGILSKNRGRLKESFHLDLSTLQATLQS